MKLINGDKLKERRASLGMGVEDLAKSVCLSVNQVKQLENGGDGSFYAPKYKEMAAKKVAAKLGLAESEVVLDVPDPEPVVADLPEASSVAGASSSVEGREPNKRSGHGALLPHTPASDWLRERPVRWMAGSATLVIAGFGAWLAFANSAPVPAPVTNPMTVTTSKAAAEADGVSTAPVAGDSKAVPEAGTGAEATQAKAPEPK
jgi:cytoskeletal protein RodZ